MLFFLIFLFSPLLRAESEPTVKIALSFDDFPMGSSVFFEKQERARVYVNTLKQLNIQAVFFCIGEQIERYQGVECLQVIAEDHLLANHSFKHLHLSELALEEFEEEVKKTEELLVDYPNFRKWYRFPYLDYGDKCAFGDRKRSAAFLFLQQTGYQHGYITINTFDWYVDGCLKNAAKEGKQIDWVQLKIAYLSLLDGWIDAYHERWSKVLHRKFVHVLLLHANDINAFFLPDIVHMIQQKKWTIVSPEEAFCSPIPYLSLFANNKKGLFKRVNTLSTTYIDQVLEKYHVFLHKL